VTSPSAGFRGHLAAGLGERPGGGTKARVDADLPRLVFLHGYPSLVLAIRAFPPYVPKVLTVIGDELNDVRARLQAAAGEAAGAGQLPQYPVFLQVPAGDPHDLLGTVQARICFMARVRLPAFEQGSLALARLRRAPPPAPRYLDVLVHVLCDPGTCDA
jgi:hypothetical protein